MIEETSGWRSGKKTRRGEPLDVPKETVTIVTRDGVEAYLGARGKRLTAHLRKLRDDGVLIHEPGRLTQRVRVDDPSRPRGVRHERRYVFRGRRWEVPRAAPRARVMTW